jgi:hypothetical protein
MTPRRRFRFVRLVVLVVAAVIFLTVTLPSVFIAVTCYRPFAARSLPSADTLRATAGIASYERAGAATFLALPEWYVTYSAGEYAAFVASEPPSRFPWFEAIARFWRTYAAACHATRDTYAFDPRAHTALGVLGVRFSIEHAIAGAYEKTLGRLAERLGGHEFAFASKLRALWRQTPGQGPHLARKWERRVALSAGYATQAVIARFIRRATGTAHAADDTDIRAWVDDVSDEALADRRVRRLRTLGPHAYIVALPRGGAFTAAALDLVRRGARFRDIAGNDIIVLSALGPPDARRHVPPPASVVLDERLLTNPVVARLAIRAPVRSLGDVIAALQAGGATIERLYDF